MQAFDVIIIGGGPAGLMAAAAAGESGARVLLIEKGNRLGRKLVISGGGRCNVTNRKEPMELIEHVPGNGRFMLRTLDRFGPPEIIAFFQGLGIKLKEEDRGRMFPVTDRAQSVLEALLRRLDQLGVETRLDSPVAGLLLADGRCRGIRLRDGREVVSGAVVVAVGGKSVPRTGSTGDGYAWAEAAGHTITPLYPTEVPLTAGDDWIKERRLMGLSLADVVLTLNDPRGKRLTAQRGDLIFTHFGLSGPAALRTGHYVSVAQMKLGPVPLLLKVDLLPDWSEGEVFDRTLLLAKAEPRKAVRNLLKSVMPERMADFVLAQAGVAPGTTYPHLAHEAWRRLCHLVKGLPVTITGTLSITQAFVTGGGVSIKEIDPVTMQSKLTPGLFFAGEVMDIHGHTGGYNITLAFSSGHTAGRSAAALARSEPGGA